MKINRYIILADVFVMFSDIRNNTCWYSLHLNTVGIDVLLWSSVVDKCDISFMKVVMGIFVTCNWPFLFIFVKCL